MMTQRLLSLYLNDHLAAETASVALFERVSRGFADTPWQHQLQLLAMEVAADRDALRHVMDELEIEESRAKQLAGLVAERVGRLKPNGHLFRRSPMTDLVEIESLRIAVAAKMNGLQVLRAFAVQEPRLSKETFEVLLDRAQDQADRLYRLHLQLAQELSVAA